jgi:antitoxin (DNA-binding transcriptional repressor) of toxin-antitoxin stability system
MDDVQRDRSQIVITKRGRPVARLVPFDDQPPAVFGFMEGKGEVVSDIINGPEERWDAEHK